MSFTPVSRSPSPGAGPRAARSDGGLETPIRYLKGIGPKRAFLLEAASIFTVEDLLYHLPFRYEDRRLIEKLSAAVPGREQTFSGQLLSLETRFNPRLRRRVISAVLGDDTGMMELLWYRAPSYLANGLAPGHRLLVHGKVEAASARRNRLVHPEFELLDAGDEAQHSGILPIYIRPGGVPLSAMRKWIALALAAYGGHLAGRIPGEILRRRGLVAVQQAVAGLHEPPPDADVAELNAFSSLLHRSVIFDEFFYLQLGLGLKKSLRRGWQSIDVGRGCGDLAQKMRKLLPFALTGAQKRVLGEVEADLESRRPMQRLIQGDVGSGKTMVAWLASLRVIENGHQALWMAPTEMLAEQHYRNLGGYAGALGIKTALLSASVPAREKKLLLAGVERGEIQFIVGTHALIQEGIRVPRMGLGVVDEQHRFGVVQRLSLQSLIGNDAGSPISAPQPHMLLMSATPIPRSMAMVLYGDMEVSFVDEMPPGRTRIETVVLGPAQRREVHARVLEELKRGHQAYIVYPLVEASEQLGQVRDATQMAEKMRAGPFKTFGVGLAHGRMAAAERDQAMRAFRDGNVGVLVATTVIEVGIDIPNATVIVIEHAERFGLSQLHQLRGRVGRGDSPGQCLLINRGAAAGIAAERLRVMAREHDGFRIAEADLALRGPGEFLGTRQSGLADFHLANLIRDRRLLMEAREEALEWLRKHPGLKSRESTGMRETLNRRWGRRLELGSIV